MLMAHLEAFVRDSDKWLDVWHSVWPGIISRNRLWEIRFIFTWKLFDPCLWWPDCERWPPSPLSCCDMSVHCWRPSGSHLTHLKSSSPSPWVSPGRWRWWHITGSECLQQCNVLVTKVYNPPVWVIEVCIISLAGGMCSSAGNSLSGRLSSLTVIKQSQVPPICWEAVCCQAEDFFHPRDFIDSSGQRRERRHLPLSLRRAHASCRSRGFEMRTEEVWVGTVKPRPELRDELQVLQILHTVNLCQKG